MRDNQKVHALPRLFLLILLLFVVVGLFAPFLANEKPIFQIDSQNHINFFSISRNDSAEFKLSAPIPYSPQNIDVRNMGAISPFGQQAASSLHQRHWLGTDLIGRDVLSALIHGARTSLLIGVGAILISAFLGIMIGGLAGYFGDFSLKISRFRFYFIFMISAFLLFYFVQIQKYNFYSSSFLMEFISLLLVQLLLFLIIIWTCNHLLKKLERRHSWKLRNLPVDQYLSRIIEIVSTLPVLFIIITLSAIFRPSIWNVVVIIGFTGWTGIARFSRAEFLSLKEQNFVFSAKALGLRSRRILFAHILPNAYPTILTALSFAFAGVILAETTLSFLGVGLPPEQASWGSMLAMARQQPSAWWLAVFPSLCIFLTIFSLHYLARNLQARKND